MKKFLIALGIVALLIVAWTVPAFAQTTDEVSATVTPKFISITVSDGDVSYGVLDPSASNVSRTTEDTVTLVDTQTVNNTGCAVDLDIRSSDAVSSTAGTNWDLETDAVGVATDQYVHEWSTDSGVNWEDFATTGTPPDNYHYVDLASNVPANTGTQNFDLQISMPTSSTGYEQRAITVTVLATEYTP